MTWDDVVGASSAWQMAEELGVAVGALEEAHPGHGALSRPRTLALVAEERLKGLEPHLAVTAHLTSLGEALTNLKASLQDRLAVSEDDPAGVTASQQNLDAAAEEAANRLSFIPMTGQPEAAALIQSVRREVKGLRAQIETARSTIQDQLDNLSQQHDQELATREQRLSGMDTKVAELEARASEIRTQSDELLNTIRTTFDASLATQAQAHRDAETAAGAQFKELGDKAAAAFDVQRSEQAEEHRSQISRDSEAAAKMLEELGNLKTEAENLVGAVGRTGLTGGFQQWEKAEREDADRMRILALAFGCLAAMSVGFFVWQHSERPSSGIDVSDAVAALALPGAFGGVAAYAGRESARHRHNQVLARRTELELASFGPFITKLGPNAQAEVTALFTTVFFGQAGSHAESQTESEAGPRSLARQLLDRIAEIVTSSRTDGSTP